MSRKELLYDHDTKIGFIEYRIGRIEKQIDGLIENQRKMMELLRGVIHNWKY